MHFGPAEKTYLDRQPGPCWSGVDLA